MCTETLDLPSVPEPAELKRAPGAADSSQPRRSAPLDTYESATNPMMSRAREPAVRIGPILHRARCKSRRFPKENEVEIQQTARQDMKRPIFLGHLPPAWLLAFVLGGGLEYIRGGLE